jgi:hypothetical protein
LGDYIGSLKSRLSIRISAGGIPGGSSLKRRQTSLAWLRLPISKIALGGIEIDFGVSFLNAGMFSHHEISASVPKLPTMIGGLALLNLEGHNNRHVITECPPILMNPNFD